jgi:hypothetical protein
MHLEMLYHDIPTALKARNQRLPGIARMVMAAAGTSSTVVVTARPMAIAKRAAMMICHTEPGVITLWTNVFFSSSATVGRGMMSSDGELFGLEVRTASPCFIPSTSPMVGRVSRK